MRAAGAEVSGADAIDDLARARRINGSLADAGEAILTLMISAALALMFLVSSMLLFRWGINYEAPGGAVWDKIHPGSWIVFATFLLSLAGSGNPVRRLAEIAQRQQGAVGFLLAWLVLLAQAVIVQKAPFTPLIDTFLMPMVLLPLLLAVPDPSKSRLALMVHLIFAANAMLGLYEFATGYRLTPYVAGTLAVTDDWRSTALFGHPLNNAILIGAYVVAICAGGARELPPMLRAAMVGLQIAAMFAFGGRSALVIMTIFVALAALRQLLAFLRGARVGLPQAALVALLAPTMIGLAIMAAQSGFFDRLLFRFEEDNGSAKARLILLHLFEVIPLPDLLLGPDQAYVASLQRLEGIEYGLESFWLATILTYGAIVAVIFFAGLFAFCCDLAVASRPGGAQVLLFFFAVASTSVSLSAKTQVFGMIVAIIVLLLRPAPKA